MRALVQRVSRAAVRVGEETAGEVGAGLLVLVGVAAGDEEGDVRWIAKKVTGLRIFPDEDQRMNLSVVDVRGGVLLVSQFTLCADVGKGTRPSFGGAMAPAEAEAMFNRVVSTIGDEVPVATGRFGAHMEVELVNEGPVTIWLDSRERGRR